MPETTIVNGYGCNISMFVSGSDFIRKNLPFTDIKNNQGTMYSFYSHHMKKFSIAGEVNSHMASALHFVCGKEFSHHVVKYNGALNIISESGSDQFVSQFSPGMWSFSNAFREHEPHNRYYAADVIRLHIVINAVLSDSFCYLPCTIKLESVMNEASLAKTEGLATGSNELKNAFIKTPVGKSMQRMLHLVKARVTHVDKIIRPGFGCVDFYIKIVPEGKVTFNNFISKFIQKYQPTLHFGEGVNIESLPGEQCKKLSPGQSSAESVRFYSYKSSSFLSKFIEKIRS